MEEFSLEAETSNPTIDALLASVGVSTLHNEDGNTDETQNLFESYSNSYLLVSANSCIIEEISRLHHMQRVQEKF